MYVNFDINGHYHSCSNAKIERPRVQSFFYDQPVPTHKRVDFILDNGKPVVVDYVPKAYLYFDDRGRYQREAKLFKLGGAGAYYLAPEGYRHGSGHVHLVDGEPVLFTDREQLIIKLIGDISKEKDRRIQTISADIRSDVLGRVKQYSKHYNNTWQHFYQRCQNVRFNMSSSVPVETLKAASLVLERIELYTSKANDLRESLASMPDDDLKAFDAKDDKHWEIEDGQ